MFSTEEKQAAKGLMENEAFVELIAKVFLETEDKFDESLVTSKTNEELGEMVKANIMAEIKVKQRFNRLKLLAQQPGEQKPVVKS